MKMLRLLKVTESRSRSKPEFRLLKLQKKIILCAIARYKSHYSSLGLDSSASPKDIKSAYYKLSFKHHPDKNEGCSESVEKFREITEAYEVLSNPEKKKEYDNNRNFQHDYVGEFWKNYSMTNAGKAPRTGRTKNYNYDEHYRQHYQQYEEERMRAEHEYFKRRWNAQYSRRYGSPEENFKQRQEWRMSGRKSPIPLAFIYFITFWIFILVINISSIDPNKIRKRQGPLYYEVQEKSNEE